MACSTHLLRAVARPPQRLFVAASALPLSLGGGFLLFQLVPDILALIGWALGHGYLAWRTYQDPYFVNVWRARWTFGERAARQRGIASYDRQSTKTRRFPREGRRGEITYEL